MPADAVVSFAGVQKVLVVKDGKAREQRIRTGRREGDARRGRRGPARLATSSSARPGDLVGRRRRSQVSTANEDARRHLHRAAGLRRDDRAVAGRRRRAPATSASASTASRASTCRRSTVRTTLPGASVEEIETQITEPIEEAVNTVEGISELRSVSGAGTSNVIVVFNLDRDIDVAAQDVRDRVAAGRARAARRDARPPIVSKFNSDNAAAISIALSGQPLGARADRDRRQDRQAAARAVGRRRRGADRRRPRARRSTSGWTPIGWPPTGCRSPRSRRRWRGRTRTRRAATSPPAPPSRCCARRAGSPIPRSSTTSSSRRVNGAPIRIRDIGRAEDGTKEQRVDRPAERRADGGARSPRGRSAPNTDRGHRSGQGRTSSSVAGGAAGRRHARDHPRPVALHRRGAARDQRAPDPRQHPRLPGRVRLHARLALHGHRRGRHSRRRSSRRSA